VLESAWSGNGEKKRRQGKSQGSLGPHLKPGRGGVVRQQPDRIARSVRGDIRGRKTAAAVHVVGGPQASEFARGACEEDGHTNLRLAGGTAVTPGFRRQTECEPCTCQDQLFTYTAVT
jgi:hypothetical protein